MQNDNLPNGPLAHLIMSPDGNLERVIVNDTEAQMAAMEGRHVTTNVNVYELYEELPPLVARDFMDEATWNHIAPSLKALADGLKNQPNPYDRHPQMMPVNARDLDHDIIQSRLSTLMQIYDPAFDLGDYVELNELWFARKNPSRPINLELLSSEARIQNWTEQYNQDPEELSQQIDQIRESMAENASERAAFGDSAPGSQRQDALGRLAEKEITHIIDHYFVEEDEEDEPLPGPG